MTRRLVALLTFLVSAGAGLVVLVTQAAGAESHGVAVVSFNYNPADVRINVGDTVEWRNLDPTVHTVTASRGEFSSGSMRQGQRFRATFNVAGVYPYFCEPHETMRGLVSVSGPTTATTTAPVVQATTTTTTVAARLAPPTGGESTEKRPDGSPSVAPNQQRPPEPPAPSTTLAVVAQAVVGDAAQASPVVPIVAVLAAAGALVGGLSRLRTRRADALRYGGAAATAATGLLHLQLRFVLDYPEPIGTLLVIEAAGAALLTTWLLARPWTRRAQLVGVAAHVAALGALAVTRTGVGLFGFREIGWDPSPQVPLAVTFGVVAVGLLSAARPEYRSA